MHKVYSGLELKAMKSVTTIMTAVSAFLTLYASQAFALSEFDFYSIGSKYGVSPYLLQAISIIESQGGKLPGNHEVSKVVNNTQLKFLEKIARYTNRPISDFKGSHKGAMGYMQIIPSTFYAYAQDGDEDGIKDPLNSYDSLATAAYILASKIAQKPNIKAAIRSYNNNSVYTKKVFTLYRELKLENKIVELLKHPQPHSP